MNQLCVWQAHRWFIKREQISHVRCYIEICHTSKLILRISWIKYVFDRCIVDISSAPEFRISMLAAKFVIRLRKYEESLQVTACREMPESESGAPEPKSAPRWSKSATFAYGFLRCSEMCFCDTELRCCMHAMKEKRYEVKEKWYEVLIGVCSWVLVECSMCALSVVNPCSFWRHGFRDQVLLSRCK